MWDGLAAIELQDDEDGSNRVGYKRAELGRPRWVDRNARPVQALVLRKSDETGSKGEEFDVELLFDE
jgi:hypothetical protein